MQRVHQAGLIRSRNTISQSGPHGRLPSQTYHTVRRQSTGSPLSKHTPSACHPAAIDPRNRTVGSVYACPGPPSQDSNVSIPASCRILTALAIPRSKRPGTGFDDGGILWPIASTFVAKENPAGLMPSGVSFRNSVVTRETESIFSTQFLRVTMEIIPPTA
jgi:hypothetical protein